MKSSISRLLEEAYERAANKIKRAHGGLYRALELAARLGDRAFSRVSWASERLAAALNRLQIRMIEPMIVASLWFGLALVVMVVAAALALR